MRLPRLSFPVVLGLVVAGCNPTAPTQPVPSAAAAPALALDVAGSACTLALHTTLREAGSAATVGQIQFRIEPPEPGSSDATVEYRGIYNPAGGPTFAVLEVALRSRLPEQGPVWSDSDKSDPGTTLTSVVRFGRTAPMAREMALALVNDASGFEAIVNVTGVTGGREAEGLVEPRRNVPESVRERQRLCFGGG